MNPMVGWIVRLTMDTGGKDDPDAAAAGDFCHTARVAAETNRRQFDKRADARVAQFHNFSQRTFDVIQIVAREQRGAVQEMLVDIRRSEFSRADISKNGPDDGLVTGKRHYLTS